MTDLVEWLETAISKWEAAAKAASPGPWRRDYHAAFMHGVITADGHSLAGGALIESRNVNHIALNDPAVVLRRCVADRKILQEHSAEPGWTTTCSTCSARSDDPYSWTHADFPCPTLLALAEGYGYQEADHG